MEGGIVQEKRDHNCNNGVRRFFFFSKLFFLVNVAVGGVTIMGGEGCSDFATEASVLTFAGLSQPSDVPSAKSHHPPPLESSGTLEVNYSRYHYAHFIDEEIEARRWPRSPDNSFHCVGSHFRLLSHLVLKQPRRQAGEA